MQPVGLNESDAILGAMRQVASAGGGPLTAADTASILAAARYLLRRDGLADIASLPAVDPTDLVAALKPGELRQEAVKYLTVMALVDGSIDTARSRACSTTPARWMSRRAISPRSSRRRPATWPGRSPT